MLRFALILSAVMLSISPMLAADNIFRSANAHVNLLELYTSEGCSSCPPAEAALSRLQNDPQLWKTFVPVAFHVDYWDSLGWRDRLSSPVFTRRQHEYAAAWKSDTVYTPAFILNGAEVPDGSVSPEQLAHAGAPAGLLEAHTLDGLHFTISYQPNESSATNWEAHIALLGCGIESRIRAGENNGRHLQHDFAVVSYSVQPLTKDKNTFRATVTLPAPSIDPLPRRAVALWISHSGDLQPVQAAGGWLNH